MEKIQTNFGHLHFDILGSNSHQHRHKPFRDLLQNWWCWPEPTSEQQSDPWIRNCQSFQNVTSTSVSPVRENQKLQVDSWSSPAPCLKPLQVPWWETCLQDCHINQVLLSLIQRFISFQKHLYSQMIAPGSLPLPYNSWPPWMNTITSVMPFKSGVQTLMNRQSSDPSCAAIQRKAQRSHANFFSRNVMRWWKRKRETSHLMPEVRIILVATGSKIIRSVSVVPTSPASCQRNGRLPSPLLHRWHREWNSLEKTRQNLIQFRKLLPQISQNRECDHSHPLTARLLQEKLYTDRRCLWRAGGVFLPEDFHRPWLK